MCAYQPFQDYNSQYSAAESNSLVCALNTTMSYTHPVTISIEQEAPEMHSVTYVLHTPCWSPIHNSLSGCSRDCPSASPDRMIYHTRRLSLEKHCKKTDRTILLDSLPSQLTRVMLLYSCMLPHGNPTYCCVAHATPTVHQSSVHPPAMEHTVMPQPPACAALSPAL